MMMLLLRMLSGASPANPYQVCAQATPVIKIEPDNSPELSWVSYAVPGFIQIFKVSRAACGFRPLAKVVSVRLRVYSQVARKSSRPKFAVFKMVVNAKIDFLHYFYFFLFLFFRYEGSWETCSHHWSRWPCVGCSQTDTSGIWHQKTSDKLCDRRWQNLHRFSGGRDNKVWRPRSIHGYRCL